MDKRHMRKLSVWENVSNYVTQLEEQNVRTKQSTNRLDPMTTIGDFKVTKIKVTMASTDSTWIEKLRAVKSKLDAKHVYEPIVLNDIVDCSYRQSFARAIKHLLGNGFPFVLTGCSILHFELPSVGPHRAAHLIWKQPGIVCS